MEHREFKRIVTGAEAAVLFVHGISGSPNHFRQLIPLEGMVPENWSVHNILLDGHGKNVEDFSRSSMVKWAEEVRTSFLTLAETHDRVFLVAHSMGTLFAIQLAAEFPDKTAGLFLLAVPLRVGIRPECVNNIARLVFNRIRDDHPMEAALRKASSVKASPYLWKYIGWVPRFLELLQQMRRTDKLLEKLQVPCMVFQSGRDELVSGRSRQLLEKIRTGDIRVLEGSSHFYYTPDDAKLIKTEFQKIMEQ